MKFRLEIELGDGHDQPLTLIGSTLRDVAQTVQSQGILFAQTRAIADHNGKNVGEWEVTEDAPSPADRAIVDALPTADELDICQNPACEHRRKSHLKPSPRVKGLDACMRCNCSQFTEK